MITKHALQNSHVTKNDKTTVQLLGKKSTYILKLTFSQKGTKLITFVITENTFQNLILAKKDQN